MPEELSDVTRLQWRSTTATDLPGIDELLSGVEYIDQVSPPLATEDIDAIWEYANDRDDSICLLGLDSNSVVSLAWCVGEDLRPGPRGAPRKRMRLYFELHPAYRDQRIGRRVLQWLLDTARDRFVADQDDLRATVDIEMLLNARWSRRATLVSTLGLRARMWFYDLQCRFETYLPPSGADPAGPKTPGVEIVPFDAARNEEIRACHNAAFADEPGARVMGTTAWNESLSRLDARPEWSWLAVADDTVVGYALNSVTSVEDGARMGWTDRLGTLPTWRGRGVARTLLTRSLESFRAAGLAGGGLGLDSAVGPAALGLYRSVGYESSDAIVRYGRTETLEEATAQL